MIEQNCNLLEPVKLSDQWMIETPLIDDDTGEEKDLAGANVVLSLVRPGTNEAVISGSLQDETITFVSRKLMQWCFPPETWAKLVPGEYDVVLDVDISGEKTRVEAGRLPVTGGAE